jgi:D-3-phosphoglycerate dehydrogenase / 2-oxoglutarate reductase
MTGFSTYIIDFDSTLIRLESLDELARIALESNPQRETILAELSQLTKDGMNGKLQFSESLQRRLALFQANQEHVAALIDFLKGQFSTSVLNNSEWFAVNKEDIYVVSGGFEDYIVPVVAEIGITPDHVFANRFVYDANGVITGYDVSRLLSRSRGKVTQVAQLGMEPPIVMIGDGYTDYEVREGGMADEFWAFVENVYRDQAVEKADKVLRSFTELNSESLTSVIE